MLEPTVAQTLSSYPFVLSYQVPDHNQMAGKGANLAAVAQWIERWPVDQKVPCLIPSQGTCLGCGPGSQLGACERQLINDVSLAHRCFSPFPSLQK